MFTKVLLVFGVTVIAFVGAADYCDQVVKKSPNCINDPICKYRNGKWAPACGNKNEAKILNLSGSLQNSLLNKHNELRNQIATGKTPKYAQAANMRTLEWDNDLANMCSLNVRQCEMVHDSNSCIHLDQFPLAGQNLAYQYQWTTAAQLPNLNKNDIITMAAKWFTNETANGEKYGYMKMIDKFNVLKDNNAYKVQHFTQYVWADASKVGCAVSTRTKNEDGKRWLYVYLCCNYDRGNIIGQSVYKAGAPASMCKTGKNPKYPGLCSIKEPNKHQNQQNNNANTNVRATRTRRNVAPPQRNNRRWGWFWF